MTNSPYAKIVVVSSVYLLIIIAAIYFGVRPAYNNMKQSSSKLSEIEAKIEKSEIMLSDLRKAEKNVSEIDAISSVMDEYLPDQKETSDFVVKSEAFAKNMNITLKTLNTTEPKVIKSSTKQTSDDEDAPATKKVTPAENSVEFFMSSTLKYPQAITLLKKLEDFPRFNTFSSVNIGSYNEESGDIDIKISGKIYYGK